jgi:hypothetical protein
VLRLLGGVVVLAAFALALARLRRVPRPRFEPVAQRAGGRVAVGRVWLARRGEPGRLLGWSVVCNGREVIGRPGAQPIVLEDAPAGEVRVRAERVATVRVDTCAVRWLP